MGAIKDFLRVIKVKGVIKFGKVMLTHPRVILKRKILQSRLKQPINKELETGAGNVRVPLPNWVRTVSCL